MIKDKETRQKFKKYFEDKGHTWYASMPLIPDDPTMLFTTAGMVQFKKQLLGDAGKLTRTASIQKCLRTTDIDEVGKTARHLTFFEMYGNFSFGDYFKEEAIQWGWEFLIDEIGLDKEKLYATVYKDDDEAFDIWRKYLPEERIVRLGEKDNFWKMGDTGPCGPCSELLIDQGPDKGCGDKNCFVGCECDRYLEVWNLVFTQYDRQEDGTLIDLPKKNIDTGMGLERLNQVMRGVDNVFETPTLKHILDAIKKEAGEFNEKSGRIIADHSRAITFMIGDGVSPSNEGRGYVLRRLIRRASREGRKLGWTEPRLWNYTATVVDLMGDYYPEINKRATHIASVCKMEEESFLNTLDSAMKVLDDYIDKLADSGDKVLAAEAAFKLHDTYGLPVDITRNILSEKGYGLDEDGFNKMMEERAQSSKWKEKKAEKSYWDEIKDIQPTKVLAYETCSAPAQVVKIFDSGAAIILDSTPMYAESGGQTGDSGIIKGKAGSFKVENTIKEDNVIIHTGILEGQLNTGDEVNVEVDCERRKAIERNHTATHILQSALRKVLGNHVQQNGSLVEPDRLRFDFTHTEQLAGEQVKDIEYEVNNIVMNNLPLEMRVMTREQAEQEGALAFFGEKYGNEVRTVTITDPQAQETVSMELCGGTHLGSTGEIGLFKIVAESGIAAGVRRIEAVTGKKALGYVQENDAIINTVAERLNAPKDNIMDKLQKIQQEIKDKDNKIHSLQNKIAMGTSKATDVSKDLDSGVNLTVKYFDDVNVSIMRSWADAQAKGDNMAAYAVGKADGKVTLILKIADKLTEKYEANKALAAASEKINGRGGGRKDMAQGGGTKVEGIEASVKIVEEYFSN
jgi:alanyl-tRNA synthetase